MKLHQLEAIRNKIAASNAAPAAAAAAVVTANPDPTPAPQGAYEDHKEEHLSFAAAGIQLLGQQQFAHLLERAAKYSSGYDVALIMEKLDAAVDKLPMAEGERLRHMLGDVARRKGVPTKAYELGLVLSALGWAEEYVRRQRKEDRAAAALELPEPFEGESISAFSSRAYAWEQQQVPALLKRSKWPGYYQATNAYEALLEKRRIDANDAAARTEIATLRADFSSLLEAYEATGTDFRDLRESFLSLPALRDLRSTSYSASAPVQEEIRRLQDDFIAYLAGHSIAFWERGHAPDGVEPPMGWEQMPLSCFRCYLHRPEALRELEARIAPIPAGHTWLLGLPKGDSRHLLNTLVVGGHAVQADWVTEAVDRLTAPSGVAALTTVSTIPSPKGWWNGTRLLGAEHYAALRLLETRPCRPGEGLDVSRVMGLWGRHPDAGYGRFYFSAYRASAMVAVDESLWTRLDAIDLLLSVDALPAGAARIPAVAEMRNGKLRISARVGSAPQTLVVLSAHQSRNGRHGYSGDVLFLADENKAPASQVSSGSAGGGQYGSAVFGAVSEAVPLLLDNGAGYVLREGVLTRVPGLAKGHPDWAGATTV